MLSSRETFFEGAGTPDERTSGDPDLCESYGDPSVFHGKCLSIDSSVSRRINVILLETFLILFSGCSSFHEESFKLRFNEN